MMKHISGNLAREQSLIDHIKRRLFFIVGLLLVVLAVLFSISIYSSNLQDSLGKQRLTIQEDLDGILNSMVDQETGLRGYVATNNSTFLEPYNTGHAQYLAYVQALHNTINSDDFSDTNVALINMQGRVGSWYNTYAEVQVVHMQSGDLATARADSTINNGKNLFDQFRVSLSQLQTVANHDLEAIQAREKVIDALSMAGSLLLSLLALLVLWQSFAQFAHSINEQLHTLKQATNRLGSGDLAGRVQFLRYQELNQLGQNFNAMADSLQQQQDAMAERDVLEHVLHLNTLLTYHQNFAALAETFLNRLLTIFELRVGALYLYDREQEMFRLFAVQGHDKREMEREFHRNEGTLGRVALVREPLYIALATDEDPQGLQIKTIYGSMVPVHAYYLPLLCGDELVGVLYVGSFLPIRENTRNVLNVVVSNLAATVSNVRAYQRIQVQAQELEQRGREQELANTELRRQRDELTVLNTALEEANQARSQFLSTMSHELRTPLTAIIGFSQVLLNDRQKMQLSTRQRSNMQRILKNGQHLLELINGVLDLAKIEAGRMEVHYSRVDVREYLLALVEETQSLALERHLELRVQVDNDVEALETDPLKLHQILLNLLANAIKFTERGDVTLFARRLSATAHEEERVAITVNDTGIGIDAEAQERIFEAFFQVDGSTTRTFGGTGLGLSIVRQLTTLLDGTIEVKSRPGLGSNFTVILPLHRSSRERQSDCLAVPDLSLPRHINARSSPLKSEQNKDAAMV